MEKNYQTFVLSSVTGDNSSAGKTKNGTMHLPARIFSLLSAILFLLVFSQQANAFNCGWGGSQVGSVNFSGLTSGTLSSSCTAGNYIAIHGTVAGQTYRLSTCGASWDTELQAFSSSYGSLGYNDDNGPACSGLPSSMDFTATGGTNYVRLTKYNCKTDGSSASISVQLTSSPCSAASTPSSISGWATGTTTASASWAASSGTATITYYWSCSNGSSGSTTGTSASVSGLSANTSYRFQVYASNCGGSSSTSYSSYFTTYPSNPTGVSFGTNPVCNGGSTTLTASGAQGTVYWYTGGCGSTYVGAGNPITVYPTSNTTYYARNNNGNWSSGCASATVTVNYPATTPATATVSSTTANTANLAWTASTGTATITHYWVVGTSPSVTYGSGTAQGSTNVSTTSATATGLSPSTNYYLRVYATNPCGSSGYRTSSMFTTVPLAPVTNAATLVRANSFTANWAASTGATGYYVDVSTSASFTSYLPGYQNRNVGNVTSLSLTGLNREVTYYYRVRAYNAGGYSVNSSTINLTTLPLNNFLIQNTSNTAIGEQLAGQAFNIKITARDEFNTTVTDYTSTVAITTNSVLTSGGTTAAFTAGVMTSHSVTLTLAGLNKTLTATSGSVESTSNTFTVTPAGINSYTLSVIGTITAGTPFSVLATVYDQYNNLKTNYDGLNSVNWTTTATSSGNGTARIIPANGDQTFDHGVATISGFTFFNSHETPTITITDGPTSSPGTTAPITVNHAILNNFLVVAGTDQAAGVPFSTTVTARDVYWNTAITYVGDIRFKSSDDALVSYPTELQHYALSDAGVRTFTDGVTINTIGSYWLRAADAIYAFKSGVQQNIVVSPGAFAPASGLSTITVDETNKIAGQEVMVTLIPKDAQGNLLYSCQNISVLLDGAVKDGTHQETHGTESGADGVYTFYVPVTSTTADNIISAKLGVVAFDQTYDITVTPAPPSLANTQITSTGGMTTDEFKVITVQLYDKFDNKRTTDDGDVTLTTDLGLLGASTSVSAAYGDAGSGSYTATLFASTDGINGTGTATISGYLTPNVTAGPGDYTAGVAPYAYPAAPWPAAGDITDNTTVVITEGLPNLTSSTITNDAELVEGQPTMTTDESATITVQLKDALGNLIVNNRGSVTLSSDRGVLVNNGYLSDGKYTATLTAGTTPINGVGLATITGSFDGNGIPSDVNGDFVESTTVNIIEGLPAIATIDISTAVATITADESTLVTVQLKDALGNLITHSRGTVTLSTNLGVIYNGSSTGASNVSANYTEDGKYTATFKMNGIGVGAATITGKINIDDAGSAVSITDNALVNVTHGIATQLAITTEPGGFPVIAGVVFPTQPVIRVNDQWGNRVTTGEGSTFTVSAARDAGTESAILQGTTEVTAVSGVATFTNLSYQVAEAITIQFTSGSLTGETSASINVVHNVPAYMVITGNSTQTAGVAQTITVKAYDTYGNQADRFAGEKSLTFSGANDSPAPPYHPTVDNVDFGNATTLNFASGSATASMMLYKEETAHIADNYTGSFDDLTYTGTTAIDIDAADISESIDNRLEVIVEQAAPAYFAITGNGSQVAGEAQTITITAYDDFNNPATGYSGSKTLKFAGANVSPAPSTSPTVGGVVMGDDYTLTFTNGVATASMVLYKAETATIVAADQAVDGITTKAGYERSVIVSHAAANYYAVTGTDATITAGVAQTITVKAYDAYNNQATSYAGDVNLTFAGADPSPAPSTNPTVTNKSSAATDFGSATTVTFAGGEATGNMKLYLVEDAIIVATAGAITTPNITGYDYRLHVTVNHAANTYFAVTGSSADQTAGTSRDIAVTMYDPYNNIATGYTGSKSITFTGAAASPNTPNAAFSPTVNGTIFGSATSLTFTDGVVTTVPMVLYNVETAHIVATDGALTTPADRNSIDYRLNIGVIHAAEDFMTISGTGTQTAGTPQTITVRAYDHYNNLATRYDGAKSLTFNGANASPEYLPTPSVSPVIDAADFGSATSLTFTAGVVTASMNLFKVETAHITTTDGTITANSHVLDVAVSHATPNYLAITGSATQTAGTSQTISVTAYDTYNNLATGYIGSKSLTFSGAADAETSPVTHPTLGGTAFGTPKSLTFTAGVATGNMVLYKTETALISATDGTINANSTELKDHRLSVLVGPTLLKDFLVYGVGTPVAGQVYTEHYYGDWQSVTVEVRDTYNNRKTNYNREISFSLTDPNAQKPADYTFTTTGDNPDNGIHTFTDAVQFSQPSDPYSPDQLGWWVTAVSILEPGKYGYQSDIRVLDRPITITANDATKNYYGDTYTLGATAFTVTSTSSLTPVMAYQNGSYSVFEQVTSVGLNSAGVPATALVGEYSITTTNATGINGFNPDYYDITYATAGTLTVNKRPITISVTPAITQSKEYGDSDPVGGYTYEITSASPYNSLVNSDEFSGTLARESGENVDTYAISQGTLSIVNGATDKYANYDVTFNGGTFNITRKAIAITVTPDQTKVYGTNDPTYAYTTDPVVSALPFTASFTGALVREPGQVVGTEYSISQGTLELIDANNLSGGSLEANYTVTFNESNFAITRKPITITVDAGIAKLYGDSDPNFTYTSSPVLASLPYSAAWTGSLDRLDEDQNVDVYTITQGSLELTDSNNGIASLAQNYDVTFNTDVLTINKRDIEITVDIDQSKVYAESDPVFTYTSSIIPLYYNGEFTGTLARATGENVASNYEIGRGTLNVDDDYNATTSLDNNYNLTFTEADFEITKKPITITVNSGQQKVYGEDDPTFTYDSSVDPLPFAGYFTGTLVRQAGNNVADNYAITRGSLQVVDNNLVTSLDDNYDLTFTGDNFEITLRPITLTANNRTKTYGDLLDLGNTQFGISGDGMAYSENISAVTLTSEGTPVAANAGTYAINTADAIGGNGYMVSNYDVTYSDAGTLTVNTRPLTLANFAAADKVYDGNTTVIGTGFDDNRMPGDVIAFTYDANFDDHHAAEGIAVNFTNVTIVGGTDQFNYHLLNNVNTFNNATTADITPKPLTITANDITKTQGTEYTFDGTEFSNSVMIGNESLATVSLTSDGAASGAGEGSYLIVPNAPIVAGPNTTLSDYVMSYINGTMTVGASGNVNLTGYVMYDPYTGNDEPMEGMTVTIRDESNDILYTAVTDGNGMYQFTNVPASIARLGVSTTRDWAGVTATDALAIQLRGINTPPAYWSPSTFMDYVGNVKESGVINSQDVLLVNTRVLHPTDPFYTFTAGNWSYYAVNNGVETVLTQIDNNAAYLAAPVAVGGVLPQIYVRPFGDIYGDYDPATGKSVNPIPTDGVLYVEAGELFNMPVRVMQDIDFSALTLLLQFDASKIQVEDLTSDIPGIEFVIDGDDIRVVWTRIEPVHFNAGEPVVNLSMRTIASIDTTDILLFMSNQTQFADNKANVIPNVPLAVPSISSSPTGTMDNKVTDFTIEAYPSPFTDRLILDYTINQNAMVKISLTDMLGATVVNLIDYKHEPGSYKYSYDAFLNTLKSGVYFVRMEVQGERGVHTKLLKVVYKK